MRDSKASITRTRQTDEHGTNEVRDTGESSLLSPKVPDKEFWDNFRRMKTSWRITSLKERQIDLQFENITLAALRGRGYNSRVSAGSLVSCYYLD